MRVAVSGHEGFVGRHVMKALDGHLIMPMDRASLQSPIALDKDFELHGIDAVIHLAAHADVRNNWDGESLVDIERDNITATLRTLEASRTAGAFVFVSTGAVYAEHSGLVTEDMSCVASSPYAASKLAGEAYVQAYAAKFGWRWYIIRPAACVGHGYKHGHIADFVRQVQENGRIQALDHGGTPRPLVHVKDLAETCVAFATGDAPSGVYNVAAGLWTWRETIAVMQVTSGVSVPFSATDKQQGWIGDGRGAVFDTAKIDRLGIKATRSLTAGVRESLESLGWPL